MRSFWLVLELKSFRQALQGRSCGQCFLAEVDFLQVFRCSHASPGKHRKQHMNNRQVDSNFISFTRGKNNQIILIIEGIFQ